MGPRAEPRGRAPPAGAGGPGAPPARRPESLRRGAPCPVGVQGLPAASPAAPVQQLTRTRLGAQHPGSHTSPRKGSHGSLWHGLQFPVGFRVKGLGCLRSRSWRTHKSTRRIFGDEARGTGEAKGTSQPGRSLGRPPPRPRTCPRGPGEPGSPARLQPSDGGRGGDRHGERRVQAWGWGAGGSAATQSVTLRSEGQGSACLQVARPSWEPAQRFPLQPPDISEHRDIGGDRPRPQPCGHTDSLAAQQARRLLLPPSQGDQRGRWLWPGRTSLGRHLAGGPCVQGPEVRGPRSRE